MIAQLFSPHSRPTHAHATQTSKVGALDVKLALKREVVAFVELPAPVKDSRLPNRLALIGVLPDICEPTHSQPQFVLLGGGRLSG